MSAIFDVLASIGDFFAMIGNFFVTLVEFVIDMLADLVYVIALLGKFVLEIPGYFMWLPDEIVVLLLTAFGIVVVYMILNRK